MIIENSESKRHGVCYGASIFVAYAILLSFEWIQHHWVKWHRLQNMNLHRNDKNYRKYVTGIDILNIVVGFL